VALIDEYANKPTIKSTIFLISVSFCLTMQKCPLFISGIFQKHILNMKSWNRPESGEITTYLFDYYQFNYILNFLKSF